MAITIGNYERFQPIGSGGYSQVYEAYDKEHARKIAVKVLTLGAEAGLDRDQFQRECQAMGSVSEHPNIVTVYESGFTDEGFPYIAMELYHGTLLDRIKERKFLPLSDVLEAGVHICAALSRAHTQGILHRDIKPQNIFYSTYGDPALGDFGIASISRDPDSEKMAGLTPHYAAPEVLDGNLPIVESDIYSLGATLYTALAGHRPFAQAGGQGEAALVNRVMTEAPPPITSQSIPAYAERTLLSFLAKHPNDRPRNAIEAGNRLRDLQAKLGLPQTPLRTATVSLDNDETVSKVGSAELPERRGEDRRKRSPQPHRAQEDFEQQDLADRSMTVARAKTSAAPTSDYETPEPMDRRLLSLAALLFVLVMVGVGIVLSLNGDDAPEASTTTELKAPVSIAVHDLSHPDKPTDLEVSDTEAGAVLSWTADESSATFLVTFVVGEYDTISTQVPEHLFEEAAADTTRCVQVTAVGTTGRKSEASDSICIP